LALRISAAFFGEICLEAEKSASAPIEARENQKLSIWDLLYNHQASEAGISSCIQKNLSRIRRLDEDLFPLLDAV
jgi:hypothetical protein